MVGSDGTPEVPGGFEAFYRREYGPMVALAYGLIGSRTAAEEIAQDAFLKAHRDWAKVSRMASPGGWVRTVTLNLARSRWRRLKVEISSLLRLGDQPAHYDAATAAEADEFWAMVRRLPARQARVLALHYVDDKSVAEIAEILDVAPGTVKALLHQARQRLEHQLRDEGWVPDGV